MPVSSSIRKSGSVLLDNPDVSVPDRITVILQIDGPGFGPGSNGRSCRIPLSRKLNIVVNHNAIVPDGHAGIFFQLSAFIIFCGGEVDIVGLPAQWW